MTTKDNASGTAIRIVQIDSAHNLTGELLAVADAGREHAEQVNDPAPLERLRAAESPEQQDEILRELRAQMTGSDDELDRVTLRDNIISILGRHGRKSPARIADAVLGPSACRTAQAPPRPSIVRTTEPWEYPVNGADLLADLATVYGRYVVLPSGAADSLALWTLHTYLFDRHTITPRLLITSPEKRCGKTTLLTILGELCARSVFTANVTAAVVFRVVDGARPTLLVDEADTFLAEASELRGVVNAGHRQGGVVLRCEGDDFEPRAYSCYAPLAVASIGKMPDTIMDRSIVIPLRRRQQDEWVDRLRLDRLEHLRAVARQCQRWADDHRDELDLDPAVPASLHDRAGDNWRVLLSIADACGGSWPDRARSAALKLTGGNDDRESHRVQLLGDVLSIMTERGVDCIATPDLLTALHAMDDRPWGEWTNGRPMTPQALSRQLGPFGITAAKWRDGADTVRGYLAASFEDSWQRYLP